MRIKLRCSLIFAILQANAILAEISREELYDSWSVTLKKYNLQMGEELRKRFCSGESLRYGIAVEDATNEIAISSEKFPGEEINYGIGFRKAELGGGDSNSFLMFYFRDEELKMIALTASFIPKKFSYDLNGFIVRQGLVKEFSNGSLSSVGCLHKPATTNDANLITKKQYCGEKINFGENGEINNIEKTNEKCSYVCIGAYPIRFPGSYVVTANDVNFRNQPSKEAKLNGKLNRNESVTLLEDTQKTEWFPGSLISASWVKILNKHGQEGYVHGSYLRAPDEPDIYEIMRKAEEWKKKNGWKGK
jgi:hypothetical protein